MSPGGTHNDTAIEPERGGAPVATTEEIYLLIRDRLTPHFAELRRCRSTAELLAHPVYASLRADIRTVLDTPEMGHFSRQNSSCQAALSIPGLESRTRHSTGWSAGGVPVAPLSKNLRRVVTHGNGRRHGTLQQPRRGPGTGALPQTLDYAFVSCYLNLAKGSGLEYQAEGENKLGLHGNAVLSRYPISRVRPIHLKNGTDKMAGREKRLGRQTALAADIEFPNYKLTVVSVHLDANSSQRHRRDQMRDVIDGLKTGLPVVIGGDWNTTTYNSSRAFHAIMGFFLRRRDGRRQRDRQPLPPSLPVVRKAAVRNARDSRLQLSWLQRAGRIYDFLRRL